MYIWLLIKTKKMIDFNNTYEQNETIHYCNEDGDVLKKYPLAHLELFIIANNLNAKIETEWEYFGSGDTRDPANWDSKYVEVHEPMSEYIDNNLLEVAEKFYYIKNKNN